jgi:DNA polymerase-3 subunit beta
MKLTILKDKLNEGVKVVERISQKSLTLPILQNTLFTAEKNFLKLSSTNLESSIRWQGLAKVEKEGQICIPTKFLSSLIGSLPDKPIELETKNLSLNLKCENFNTKIKGLSSEDFPIIPQPKEGKPIIISNTDFCQALTQIINIPSPSTTRPEISGVFLSFQPDSIKMVATDSFRLAEKKIFLKTGLPKGQSLIIPQTAAKEIIGVFGDREGDIRVYLSPNQILFEYASDKVAQPQIEFTSRLVEGEYPDYQEIIPKEYHTETQVKKKEFLNQVKAASLFSGKINEVKISFDSKKGQVNVASQSPDLGEYDSFFKGKVKGQDVSISFNHRFLAEGISEINSEEVVFNLTDEDGAATLKPTGKSDYLYIIMPIKPS